MRLMVGDDDRLRASFSVVAAEPELAADVFYRRLFEARPELRALFVTDLRRQGDKLMSTLGLVVARLHDLWPMMAIIEDLALRHLAYGVRPEHYAIAGDALFGMLEERLGPAFTPDVEASWRRAYAGLSGAMLSAAYRPEDGPGDR